MQNKAVINNHYHLWTDALHARTLANQARNKWDRGTYVRWAILTSWVVLEVACQDALNANDISYSFRKNLDKAIKNANLPPLDWGKGIWQAVVSLQGDRKDFVHRSSNLNDLFPEALRADKAIEIVRSAVQDIYQHAGKPVPTWISDNSDRGWDIPPSGFAIPTVHRQGANENDPMAVKITFVYEGKEHITEVLHPGSDPDPYVQDLLDGLNPNFPISQIKVYVGSVVVKTIDTHMRGL